MTDFVQQRRARAARAWQLESELVLIGAGEPISKPGASPGDQVYPFRPHPEFFWLTDHDRPGSVLAFDPQDAAAGAWCEFTPPVSESQVVWEGREPRIAGEPLPLLAGWLAQRRGRPVVNLGAPIPGLPSSPMRTAELRERLTHARRVKDAVELDHMRRAVAATAAGFARAAETIAPGRSEREVQIELEAEFFRHGADATAYDSIVGAGPNAGVLHFSPSQRRIAAGDFVLIDAGAEVAGYAADVTRTFTAGKREGFAAELYDIVLQAERRAIDGCRAGQEFRELHLASARDMAAGLVELGVLRGQADNLVEQDAHALFFPHGLGHLVGLGVRDASGYLPGRRRSDRFGLNALRCDFPLAPGYVTTIEPGLYFIPALLNDPARREKYADAVNWPLVERHLHIGGVRIEDNVLVTEGAPQVLTAAIAK